MAESDMNDCNIFSRLIHSRLAITTTNGNFEGVLKFVFKQRATFEHIYEIPSREYLGTMHILLSSISSYRILKPVDKNFESSNFDLSNKLLLIGEFDENERVDNSAVVEIVPEKKFVEYLPNHLRKDCPTDFHIVDVMDIVFFDAVKELSDSINIGASFHGPRLSRSGILTWLCLSNSACVYLFDIEKLGKLAFEKGLKEILESEKIEKVIHDCREVSDCLFHVFNTELKSIFDTQVADYVINMQMCTGKRTFEYVNSLDSCLFKYLKVPQQFLYNRNKSALYYDEVKFYQKRPINQDFINFLMKSCMYLPLLKKNQEKLLMSPYEQAVELYLNCARSASDSEVHIMHSEPSYLTPDCLIESVEKIRFCEIPQPPDDTVKLFRQTPHGKTACLAVKEKNRFIVKMYNVNLK